jgi:hypothetical protein
VHWCTSKECIIWRTFACRTQISRTTAIRSFLSTCRAYPLKGRQERLGRRATILRISSGQRPEGPGIAGSALKPWAYHRKVHIPGVLPCPKSSGHRSVQGREKPTPDDGGRHRSRPSVTHGERMTIGDFHSVPRRRCHSSIPLQIGAASGPRQVIPCGHLRSTLLEIAEYRLQLVLVDLQRLLLDPELLVDHQLHDTLAVEEDDRDGPLLDRRFLVGMPGDGLDQSLEEWNNDHRAAPRKAIPFIAHLDCGRNASHRPSPGDRAADLSSFYVRDDQFGSAKSQARMIRQGPGVRRQPWAERRVEADAPRQGHPAGIAQGFRLE